MTRAFFKPQFAALFTLAILLLLSISFVSAQEGTTDEPETQIVATSEPFEVVFGSGSFNLFSPTQGLSDLSSYRATLTVSFDGVTQGQEAQWSRTYTMLVTQTPPARQLTIEYSEDAAASTTIAEVRNTVYERRDGSACVAKEGEADNTWAEWWEPAGFLDSVIGAYEAGSETVNDVVSNHYTFDESAQGISGIESTGELWVASDGGYLVRYTLTTTAGEDYFGEGIEGVLLWDYQLSDVNQAFVIEIPDDCHPPLLNIAVMPDAVDVVQTVGFTSYTTSSGLEDVVAFYEEQIAALGGQSANPPMISANIALFGFTQGNQPLLLIASDEGSNTSVRLQQVDNAADLSIAAEVPPIVIAPEDTLGHCAAGGTPILDDASEVISLSGGLNYITSTSAEDAAAFYQEQFTALGAEVSAPMTISGITGFDVTQGFHQIRVTLLAEGLNTRVSLTSATGSPVTPVTNCAGSGTGECEAGGIPMLSDATNVQNVMGLLTYNTKTSIADAVAFYEEQIAAQGGQITSSMPASDMMAVLEVQISNQSLMVMIAASGGANNVNITSLTGNPLPPPNTCVTPQPVDSDAETPPETSDAVCTVTSATGANQRSGPGTSFDLAGTLAGGSSLAVDGQATGTDGFVWWRLGEGVWVRSDVVDEAGDCEGVPIVQP